MHTIQIEESERQMILLAMARLSMERPGWLIALNETALKFDNKGEDGNAEMLYRFRKIWTDAAAAALVS